jgi:hypothetical protein
MTEEKLKNLESENSELRAELERLKRPKPLTLSDLPPAEAEPPRKSAVITTNAPSDSPAPLDLQTARLEQPAPEEKAKEILERVKERRRKSEQKKQG